jgi:hypothetical protein
MLLFSALTNHHHRAHVGTGAQRLVATPQQGQNLQRPWTGLGPVKSASSPAMACNTPGTPARFSAEVKSGTAVTAHWNPWPHDGGPLSVWMVECHGDCSTFAAPHTASWFKVHDDGLAGTQKLIRASNSLTVTIPASLKPGNYLIRHEVVVCDRKPTIPSDLADKSIELGQTSRRILSRVCSIEGYWVWNQIARTRTSIYLCPGLQAFSSSIV